MNFEFLLFYKMVKSAQGQKIFFANFENCDNVQKIMWKNPCIFIL